jgi:oxygen-independent coproporphyrinogen-3 oxidase
LIPDYVDALTREIRLVGEALANRQTMGDQPSHPASREVHTVYFGGGTPSLLPLEGLDCLLRTLNDAFLVGVTCEITLEANPGTVHPEYLKGLREIGVNRLSLGVQSAKEEELRLLGRKHTFADSVETAEQARRAGFKNLNLDLILGIPRQSRRDAMTSLGRVLDLDPEHLSLYVLSLEEGTPLEHSLRRGLLPSPDPDVAADMMEAARDLLSGRGYFHYEVSNWAKASDPSRASGGANQPSFACRHNLQYWRNQPYLGLGAGAHGYVEGHRYSNVLSPGEYVERMKGKAEGAFPFSPAVGDRNRIDRQTEMGETMMMGLRLIAEGVQRAAFRARFGVELEAVYSRELRELESAGLIECPPDCVRLSRKGWLLGNQVFRAFV